MFLKLHWRHEYTSSPTLTKIVLRTAYSAGNNETSSIKNLPYFLRWLVKQRNSRPWFFSIHCACGNVYIMLKCYFSHIIRFFSIRRKYPPHRTILNNVQHGWHFPIRKSKSMQKIIHLRLVCPRLVQPVYIGNYFG